jgi:hypothetical protein
MVLLSHAGDDALRVTWPQCDVDVVSCCDSTAESCGPWRCRGDFAAVRCRCQVMLATVLLSLDGDGTAGKT